MDLQKLSYKLENFLQINCKVLYVLKYSLKNDIFYIKFYLLIINLSNKN